MAERDLKRCPFCGGEAYLDDPTEIDDWAVSCKSCGAFAMFGTDGESQTKEEATEAWNRRAEMGKRELKPCPFCGSTEIKVANDQGFYFVYCDQCVCETAKYVTEDEAIKAWNRRANDDS